MRDQIWLETPGFHVKSHVKGLLNRLARFALYVFGRRTREFCQEQAILFVTCLSGTGNFISHLPTSA